MSAQADGIVLSKGRARKGIAFGVVGTLIAGLLVAAGFGIQAANAVPLAPEVTASSGSHIAGEDLSLDISVTGVEGAGAQFNLSLGVVMPADVTIVDTGSLGEATVYPAGTVLSAPTGSDCTSYGLESAAPSAGCRVPADRQYAVFQNVSDLPQGASVNHALMVRPNAATFAVGSTVDVAVRAYTSDDERWIPVFPGSTSKSDSSVHTSAPGMSDAGIPVLAFRVEKSEPSPEAELLRGVHDNATTYTLRVHHTAEGDIASTKVVDFLPAGLEYLGDGSVDHTTGTEEYPQAGDLTTSAPERFVTPSAVDTIVATPQQAADHGIVAGDVYTMVTWELGTVAAQYPGDIEAGVKQAYSGVAGEAGYFEIQYRAGIPLFENTMDWSGETPAADGLGQTANLDNNGGASTRHVSSVDDPTGVQSLRNVAVATGQYDGAAVESIGDHTVDAVDVRVVKSVSVDGGDTFGAAGTFTQNDTAVYRLDIATSEYVTAAQNDTDRIIDVLADGLCPAIPAGAALTAGKQYIEGDALTGTAVDEARWSELMSAAGVNAAECGYDSTATGATFSGEATVSGIAFDPASGQFSLIFELAPDALSQPNAELAIEYAAVQNAFYRSSAQKGATTSGDSVTNTAHVLFTTTSRAELDGVASATGAEAFGTVQAGDDSAARLRAELSTLTKAVLPRDAGAVSASEVAGIAGGEWVTDATAPFSVGDTTWYRLTVTPPAGADVRNARLTDYLPEGVAFDRDNLAQNMVIALSDQKALGTCSADTEYVELTGEVDPGILTWNIGETGCLSGESTTRFLPGGVTVDIYLKVTITSASDANAVDLPQNLAKYQQENVDGVVSFERADATVALDGGASLIKGIESIDRVTGADVGPNAFNSDVDGQPVVQGDKVRFRIDVSTPENPTTDYTVVDVLPAGIRAADVSSFAAQLIEDGIAGAGAAFTANAYDPGATEHDAAGLNTDYRGRSVIVWTISSELPGSDPESAPTAQSGASLFYTLTVPDGGTEGGGSAALINQSYVNDAGIVSYGYESNGGSTTIVVPQQLDAAGNPTGGQQLTDRTPGAGEYGVDQTATFDDSDVYVPDAAIAKSLVATEVGPSAPVGAASTVGLNGIDAGNSQTQIVQGELATYDITVRIPAHTTVSNGVLQDSGNLTWTGSPNVNGRALKYQVDSATLWTAPGVVEGTGTLPADFAFDAATGKLTFPATYSTGAEERTFTVRLVAWVDDRDAGTPGHSPDLPNNKVLANTASFQYSDVAGTPTTRSASATATFVEPALSIDKTASPASDVRAGQTISYAITISNPAGRVATFDNVVTDTVPEGLDVDLDSFTVTVGATTTPLAASALDVDGDVANGEGGTITIAPNAVTQLATIPGGAPVTIGYTAMISESVAAGQAYTNRANATGYTLPVALGGDDTVDRRGDRVVADDATVTAITAQIDKGVRIGDGDPYASTASAPIGETASYRVDVTLQPNINYYNARITDRLPAGVSLVDTPVVSAPASIAGDWTWTDDNGALTGTYDGPGGDISSHTEPRTITVTYRVELADTVADTVDDLPNTAGFSWTVGENGDRETITDIATVDVLDPTLQIVKTVEDAESFSGDADSSFDYSVEVRNTGDTPAHNIVITDEVPTGVIVDADTITGGGQLTGADSETGGGVITWEIDGPLAAYDTEELRFTYSARFADSAALTGDDLVNTAKATHFESFPEGGRVYEPTDVTDAATVTPLFPSVELEKSTAGTDEAFVGDPFAWKLSAVNTGEGAAQTVTLTDTLPVNWAYDDTVAPIVYVGGALIADPPAAVIGTDGGRQIVTWTFGSDAAAALPGTASGATEAARTITVQFATVPGEDALTAAGAGLDIAHTNDLTAVVTDPTGADRNASGSYVGPDKDADAHIARSDLKLEKAAVGGVIDAGEEGVEGNLYGLDAGTWIAGQPAVDGAYAQPQWRITVTNQHDVARGPFAIVDTQTLPDGVTSGSFTAQYFSTPDATGTPLDLSGAGTEADPYIVGDNSTTLKGDGTDRIEFVADLGIAAGASTDPEGAPTNTASVSGRTYETPSDIDKDNESTATHPITARADLEVVKTVNTAEPNAGSRITWGITVRNLGPSASLSGEDRRITVTDVVPDGIAAVDEPEDLDGWAVSASAGWPASAGDTVTWTFAGDSIAVGAGHELLLTGTIDPAWTGDVSNTAEVAAGLTEDPNGENDSSTVTITPTIDTALDVAKTRVVRDGDAWRIATDEDAAHWGDPVSYRVTVVNNGPAAAQDVTVVDEVPAGLRYDSHAPEGDATWTRTAGGVNDEGASDDTWETFALVGTQRVGADAARSFVVTYTTDPAMPASTDIVNWVEASAINSTNAPRDDDSTGSSRTADLSVVKSHTGDALAGSTLDYTIVVTNNGPSISDGPIVVTDDLPAGFGYVADSAVVTVAGGAPVGVEPQVDGQVLTWTPVAEGATLAQGATVEITLTVAIAADVRAQTGLANVARVDGPNDPDPTNDESTDPTTVVTEAVMTIVKDVEPGPWVAGTDVEYTITIDNAGPSAADAAVSDLLPAGLTPVSIAGAGWTCDDDTESCTRAAHPVGSSTITVIALIDADVATGTELVNTATLSWTDSRSPVPHELSDPAEITVTTAADLSLAKRAVDADGQTIDRVIAGTPVLYELVATNHGPSDAIAPLTVTDTLPVGVRFASLVTTDDWTAEAAPAEEDTAQTVVFTRNPATVGIRNGADAPKIRFEAYVDASVAQDAALTNHAVVASGTPDPDPTNDEATSTVTVDARADLGITKTGVGTPTAGEEYEWIIEVANHGDSDSLATEADPILVTDRLPAGVTLVEASSTDGAVCDTAAAGDGMFTCAITSTLAPNDTVAITVRVAVAEDVTGTLENTAIVDPGLTPEPEEPVHPNEAADITPPVVEVADLAIEKTVLTDAAQIVAGQQITWQLTVTNLGPSNSDASAESPIVVSDVMPAGVAIDSVTGPNADWTCEPADGSFTCELVADLATGDPQVITVTGTIDPSAQGELENVATVTPGLTPQPADSEENDTDRTTSTVIESADLRLLKDVSSDIIAGATGRYMLQVFNGGPSTARDVVITDTLPDTLTFERVVVPEGASAAWECAIDAHNPQLVVCAYLDTIPPGGAPVTLEIEVSAASDLTGDIVNTAVVSSSTPDPDPGNNAGEAPGTFQTLADLEIVKSHAPDAAAVAGEPFTWTLTVANNGPSDSAADAATPIRVSDPLPAGATFLADGSADACVIDTDDAQLVLCDITETIPAGGSVQFDVQTLLDPALTGALENTASVAPGSTVDPEPTNNDSTDIVHVVAVADLAIAKAVTTPSDRIVAGADIEWTITVTNNGPSVSDAAGDDPITVTDALPAGVSFVSASGDGWTCEPGEETVVCDFASALAVGGARRSPSRATSTPMCRVMWSTPRPSHPA